eukprot:s1225_g22.t3
MLNDRDKVNRAFSQIGFIEFMIAPWVEALVPMFPVLDFMADYTADESVNLWVPEHPQMGGDVGKRGGATSRAGGKAHAARAEGGWKADDTEGQSSLMLRWTSCSAGIGEVR